MASQIPNNKQQLLDLGESSTRCPAGSHIRTNDAAATAASSLATKSFLTTDSSQSTTDQARIEARKHHKRLTDAIYARRRRIREKEDEKLLMRETEQRQRENKKLRQENNELQTMLDRAVLEIESRGDRKWLQEVFVKTTATPAPVAVAAADSNPVITSSSSSLNHQRSHRPETTTAEERVPQRPDPPRSSHLRSEEEMEALRQASYLQGLQDAALLQQQQQPQRDSLWLTELRNDPRTIEQLYLARRLQALGAYPTMTTTTTANTTEHSLSSILRPELTSFLEQRRALQSSVVDSLWPRATTGATILAAAALERYRNQTAASRLGRTTTTAVRTSHYPPPPPPQRQWPLGLWINNAWDDRANSSGLSSLFLPPARDPPLSLPPPNSGLPGDTPPRLNFPPL